MQRNKIWIELALAESDEFAELQCQLANKMLARLGVSLNPFFWDKKAKCYCFGGDWGYNDLPDRGKWLSLDALAGE